MGDLESQASKIPESKEQEILQQSSQRMAEFKDKHKGERCVIIGNGPSLNKMDLSFLRYEFCFGLNRIYLGFEKWDFVPTYYVAVNRLVIEQSAKEIEKIPCPKFISNRGIHYLKPQRDILFIKTKPEPNVDFSNEPQKIGLPEGSTVTYVAIQIAFYMGFEKVILIGVDHNFVTQGSPHEQIVSSGEDCNHFHPNYFGKGTKWHSPDLETSEKYYQIAAEYFYKNGRQIIDATVDGFCPVFPKQDYRELFFREHSSIYIKSENSPKVSVIIAADEQVVDLQKTVASVLSQQYPNYEVVVVDNGFGNCVLQRLQQSLSHIRYVRENKPGILHAWNRGLAVAEGDFVLFLPGDSYLIPGRLTQLMSCIQREKADMVFGARRNMWDDKDEESMPWEELPDLDDLHIWKLWQLWRGFSKSIIMFRRNSLRNLGSFDYRFKYWEMATIDVVLRLGLRHGIAIWLRQAICDVKKLKITINKHYLIQDMEQVVHNFFVDRKIKKWMFCLKERAKSNFKQSL